jgi:hypothetical protein
MCSVSHPPWFDDRLSCHSDYFNITKHKHNKYNSLNVNLPIQNAINTNCVLVYILLHITANTVAENMCNFYSLCSCSRELPQPVNTVSPAKEYYTSFVKHPLSFVSSIDDTDSADVIYFLLIHNSLNRWDHAPAFAFTIDSYMYGRNMQDLRFSQRWLRRVPYSGI